MQIVVFGENFFTLTVLQSLIDSGFTVLAIISPYKEGDEQYRGLQMFAERNAIDFLRENDVNSKEIEEYLLSHYPDIILCVHLQKVLKRKIFSQARLGAINLHPSLLPKYRGLSPLQQPLLNGDDESGVTVHFIDDGVDTGDIVIQEIIAIRSDTCINEFQRRVLEVYKYIAVKALKLIGSGDLKLIRQDHAQASYFGRLKKSDREINVKKTKTEAYNLIRASTAPYKGAFIGNYVIWSALFCDESTEKDMVLKLFQKDIYFDIQNDKLFIRLNDGILVSDDFDII